MAEECWRDVAQKLQRWHAARPTVEAFAADWDRHREALRGLVATPDVLARALEDAGAPAKIGELDPPAPEPTVRWALRALPLMRNRFTVADLRFFAGGWDDATVDDLLARSGILGVPV
jgi:glycerol-1-phosphate dehydrogenase [NAD(P)+]